MAGSLLRSARSVFAVAILAAASVVHAQPRQLTSAVSPGEPFKLSVEKPDGAAVFWDPLHPSWDIKHFTANDEGMANFYSASGCDPGAHFIIRATVFTWTEAGGLSYERTIFRVEVTGETPPDDDDDDDDPPVDPPTGLADKVARLAQNALPAALRPALMAKIATATKDTRTKVGNGISGHAAIRSAFQANLRARLGDQLRPALNFLTALDLLLEELTNDGKLQDDQQYINTFLAIEEGLGA